MPIQRVESDATEHLQEVANALLKARKIVVVTGAGISTNSGIPDFRSENGLYSLIQAQFDDATRTMRQSQNTDDERERCGDTEGPRPAKRWRKSVNDIEHVEDVEGSSIIVRTEQTCLQDVIEVKPMLLTRLVSPKPADRKSSTSTRTTAIRVRVASSTSISTPKPNLAGVETDELTTSPSSLSAEDPIVLPSTSRTRSLGRPRKSSVPPDSSPLSSPPPDLFDPFPQNCPPEDSSRRRGSASSSEMGDDEPRTHSSASSQSSTGGRGTLPNMKGKDLFDVNIWSDPVRTSVFYTFATSLRQKIKSAEPTTSHRFISHLRDRGKLVRCYTQNIDQIEEKVGLSTCLQDGPGSRGRFSRKSTASTMQLESMVEEAGSKANEEPSSASSSQSSPLDPYQHQHAQMLCSDEEKSMATSSPAHAGDGSSSLEPAKVAARHKKREAPLSGVECVFLHGSLELLRCFLCGRVTSWDDEDRETETLSGQQPACPHCVGATVAREERGKRALGVGKLRPDIVLYGEEHPNSHLISPIVTHDLGLYPDLLLILGTSLRVHGLKVMVREFAKAVHSKGGRVVFVNYTKPPESIWGDVIDYWVHWDCDAWVDDLQARIPKLWQEPEPPRSRKKREVGEVDAEGAKEHKKRPPAANPVALRDTRVTGAFWTRKILEELHRITGSPQLSPVPKRSRRVSTPANVPFPESTKASVDDVVPDRGQQATKSKARRPRKSAPGALEKTKRPSSTLNPNHGRLGLGQAFEPSSDEAAIEVGSQSKLTSDAAQTPGAVTTTSERVCLSSILSSVKDHPRVRKRKVIDGEEVPAPSVGKRRSTGEASRMKKDELRLPPIQSLMMNESRPMYGKLQPLEPKNPPVGPLSSLSPNLRSVGLFQICDPFDMNNAMFRMRWPRLTYCDDGTAPSRRGIEDETSVTMVMTSMRTLDSATRRPGPHGHMLGKLEGQLMSWGASWSCNK